MAKPLRTGLQPKKPLTYAEKQVVGKFQLLRGRHCEGDPEIPGGQMVYEPGDIFESKSDLRLIDRAGDKFKPIGEIDEEAHKANLGGGPVEAYESRTEEAAEEMNATDEEDEAIAQMNLRQLREYADDEDIDLTGTRNKTEVLQKIRAERVRRGGRSLEAAEDEDEE